MTLLLGTSAPASSPPPPPPPPPPPILDISAVTAAWPLPIQVPSHLASLFGTLYSSFSRDPLPAPALYYTLPAGASATLVVSGATALLYCADGHGNSANFAFNLAVDIHGARPTIGALQSWLLTSLQSLVPLAQVSAPYGTYPLSLTAITVPEGSYGPGMVPYATSINYCLLRVISLLFDLMSADSANMLQHMSVVGAQGYWLDWIGNFLNIPRLQNTTTYPASGSSEPDDIYRRRIMRTLAAPFNNNAAIARLLQESLNLAGASVLDYYSPTQYGLFTISLSQPSALAVSQIVGLVNSVRAPGTSLAAINVIQPSRAWRDNLDLLPTTGSNASSALGHSTPSVNLGTRVLNGVTRIYTASSASF